MTPIHFFDGRIRIAPHTARHARNLSVECGSISIEAFAAGRMVSLYRLENGEYLCRALGGEDFIEGPEVSCGS